MSRHKLVKTIKKEHSLTKNVVILLNVFTHAKQILIRSTKSIKETTVLKDNNRNWIDVLTRGSIKY